MKKLYARMNDCKQYSEDAWESIVHIKEIDETTTIGDLVKWQNEIFFPFVSGFMEKSRDRKKKNFPQIYINEGE